MDHRSSKPTPLGQRVRPPSPAPKQIANIQLCGIIISMPQPNQLPKLNCKKGRHPYPGGGRCPMCYQEWYQSNGELRRSSYRRRYHANKDSYRITANMWRSKNPELATWSAMRDRCEDPKNEHYSNYGGRGITVCERWKGRGGYRNFLSDVGRRPNHHYSIDRIDVNGNYEPGNCRWITATEQARNKTNNRMVLYEGRTQCVAAWADELGMRYHTLSVRIKKWGDIERAFTQEVR